MKQELRNDTIFNKRQYFSTQDYILYTNYIKVEHFCFITFSFFVIYYIDGCSLVRKNNDVFLYNH